MKLQPISVDTSRARIMRAGRSIELEYQLINTSLADAPLLVFLHEGLGSVSMWRDWPKQVCQALKCRGLVYSRYGYGQSTPRRPGEPRTTRYLHDEAQQDLPALLSALGLHDEKPILYGHSDGGTIALIYAACFPERVSAIAVAAPHIFVEDITIQGIAEARKIYESTDMRRRLERHHKDPDSVFRSWNDVWLTPEFKDWNIEDLLGSIQCPVLAIQGQEDEYGTLEQIQGIQRHARQTRLCVIPDCGHSPHRDAADTVIRELGTFINTYTEIL